MTILPELPFTEIDPKKTYLYFREEYQRYGSGDHYIMTATGQEIIDALCETYDYDPTTDLHEFLVDAQDANGEDDYFQVFELPTIN